MKKKYILVFVFIIAMSCKDDIQQIIINKDKIVALAINKDIINDRERNFYALITYKLDSNLENKYFFSKGEKDVIYMLLRDSIEFSPDNIINPLCININSL